MSVWDIIIYTFISTFAGLGIAAIIVLGAMALQKYHERKARRRVDSDGPGEVMICGPWRGGYMYIAGKAISVSPLQAHEHVMINTTTGDITYHYPIDTHTTMDTIFSLDELEAAQDYITGKKPH